MKIYEITLQREKCKIYTITKRVRTSRERIKYMKITLGLKSFAGKMESICEEGKTRKILNSKQLTNWRQRKINYPGRKPVTRVKKEEEEGTEEEKEKEKDETGWSMRGRKKMKSREEEKMEKEE